MKYMLILQLPETIFKHDEIISFENAIIGELKGIAEVDGHDIGLDEINFFIITDDVHFSFNKIKHLFTGEIKKALKAAYRELNGEQYHILHPSDLKEFHIL